MVNEYWNLVGQLKHALKGLKNISSPSPAAQYFLADYLEQATQPLLVDPLERSTRRRPAVGQDVVNRRVLLVENRKADHRAFLNTLSGQADHYWFQHGYWQREDPSDRYVVPKRLKNIAALFNLISETLKEPLADPVKPSHQRCSVCSQYVRFNDKSHGCTGATLSAVPSLVSSYKRVVAVDPAAIAGLSDNPEHVTDDDIQHLVAVVRSTRQASTKTLREWLKWFVKKQAASSSSIEPGMLQLLVVGCGLAPSEAIAETFGSVMEKYHNTRFFNPGPANDDVRLQKEMFIRLNGPKLGVADSLCQRVASRLDAKPTATYSSLRPDHRAKKVSKVIKRMASEKPGFFK